MWKTNATRKTITRANGRTILECFRVFFYFCVPPNPFQLKSPTNGQPFIPFMPRKNRRIHVHDIYHYMQRYQTPSQNTYKILIPSGILLQYSHREEPLYVFLLQSIFHTNDPCPIFYPQQTNPSTDSLWVAMRVLRLDKQQLPNTIVGRWYGNDASQLKSRFLVMMARNLGNVGGAENVQKHL